MIHSFRHVGLLGDGVASEGALRGAQGLTLLAGERWAYETPRTSESKTAAHAGPTKRPYLYSCPASHMAVPPNETPR